MPSTTCPSRSICAGPRSGRWVPLTRLRLRPEVQRQRRAFGQRRKFRHAVDNVHREPARVAQRYGVAARVRHDRPAHAKRASRSRSSREADWNAAPANRETGPRRTTRQAGPAQRPRSSNVSGVRSATVKPKSVKNRSARSRSGFSNSSHARRATLISGFADRPGCSPGQRPGLAVQRTVRVLPHARPVCWRVSRRVSFHANRSSLILYVFISLVINYHS